MGDLKMCEALINRGCNSRQLNDEGQTPTMRSVLYTNSYSRRTFDKILDLLRDSLLDLDSQDRTILHHIALSTESTNNLPSARYYIEVLLQKITEMVQPTERVINFINHQDRNGNTALHILTTTNAKKCIKILLSYNARTDIPNNKNEYAIDYLYHNSLLKPEYANHLASTASSFNLRPFNPQLNGVYQTSGYLNSHTHQLNQQQQQQHLPPSHQSNLLQYAQSQIHHVPAIHVNNGSVVHTSSTYHNGTAGNQIPGNNNNNSLYQFSQYGSQYFLNLPHTSEAAMQISHKSNDLLDTLGELSNVFDVELEQKNSHIKELQNNLKQMNNDVKKISNECEKIMVSITSKYSEDEIKELIEKGKNIKTEDTSETSVEEGDDDDEKKTKKELQAENNVSDQNKDDDKKLENGSVKDSTKSELKEKSEQAKEEQEEDKDILIVKSLLDDTRNEYINKAKRFKQLIERSQAKNLATTVVEKENEVLKNKDIELKPIEINEKTISFVLELISLQLFRKRAVDDILTLYADASENTETISKYRRLVSKLSKVPIQEVDESLNGIEECLKHDDL
ncbi:unnamed protein product [[Candida] boidinii]|nr:unnamed protein product [[Candida] boidinii]